MSDFDTARAIALNLLSSGATLEEADVRTTAQTALRALREQGAGADVDVDRLVRELEANLNVVVGSASTLTDDTSDHIPWLPQGRAEVEWHFTRRYQRFLRERRGWAVRTRYAAECAARKEQASQALRRPQLQEALDTRRELEARAAEAEVRRAESRARLGAVHLELGLGDTEPLDQAESVRRWLTDVKELQPAKEEAWREWTDLQALLDGTSMAEMAEKARQSGEVAERLAVGIDQSKLLQADPADVNDEGLEDLQRRHQDAQRQLGERRGAASELASTMLNVAEVEEDLATDRAQYERLSNVADVLNKTSGFLEQAQDRIHHDLAPILQAAVRSALPRITGGRYTDVRVDAKSLAVKVLARDGEWREASLLSHGTAEQIYLLLRVGLAKHLTAPNKTCPLILDDVTVKCDSQRKAAVLELLHEISSERQVILFSQEREVLEWAKASLGEEDQLLDLSPAKSGQRRVRTR